MSSEKFTKSNLDFYLKELAKEYKKLNRKAMPAEIILVGGAAVLANYGFRDMTTDIDAVICATSSMKDAINRVGDKYNLPTGWLNHDFVKTASYSSKLSEVSIYYKSFYGVLDVRTVSDEYLIAMKLRSGRKYKNDLSDILGILDEHKKCGTLIDFASVEAAVFKLYGGWEGFSEYSKFFIRSALANENYEEDYIEIKKEELENKMLLRQFEKDYSGVLKTTNLDNVLEGVKKHKGK